MERKKKDEDFIVTVRVSALVQYLGDLYPYALAEEWDNVGLIFGDPRAEAERALLAVDLSREVADEAARRSCAVVITHHPPIFRPVKSIDLATTQGDVIAACLRQGIASIALHTNLDSAAGGLNDIVCELLGLVRVKPLESSGKERYYKLAVFTPRGHADKVREALFDAGAGVIGKYSRCSFNVDGAGTFLGDETSAPAIGEAGRLERVDEVRIEVLLRRESFVRVVSALRDAHPYEEAAYDLYPLANRERETGLGRVGSFEQPVALREFCERLTALDMMVLRFIGDPRREIRKVALCTGAGSDFSGLAASAGADVYLTAEMKHHHALDAARRGMAVVETDHYTLERVFRGRLADKLNARYQGRLETIVSADERNPWTRYP